jgi:hypothetical protein
MRFRSFILLAGVCLAQPAWAQPGPPSLPPRPELPPPPGFPGPDRFPRPQDRWPVRKGESQSSEQTPASREPGTTDAPLPYEPPRAATASEKRLRDMVFGLLCVVPLGLAGAGLMALTQWKRPHLSGPLYARGVAMGALLVGVSVFMAVAIVLRLLFGIELREHWS